MLTYERLAAKPGGFRSMTGLSVEELQSPLARVTPRYEATVRSQTERADRRRAPGGGEKSRHDLTERLLMTMVWLKVYTIGEMKHFQALAAKFRHRMERHKQVVNAIVGIVDRRIDNRLAKLPTPCSTTT